MFTRNKQPAIKSLIAQGSRVEGDVYFTDGLRIDGQVIGAVRADGGEGGGLLVISVQAKVEGAVHAAHVIINGEVVGPVHATSLLELQPKARITGDVFYKALEMHQGATIFGRMVPSDVALEEKPPLKLASNTN